jgi:flavodoxin
MKSLVVYYSRTGNAKFMAEKIAEELGADIEAVIDEKNRRGMIGWLIAGYDATRGKETKIAETKKLPGDFDLIIIGTPVWNARPSPAIRTYLRHRDLSGKKTAIFLACEGRGDQRAIALTKALIPGGDFVGELVVSKALKNREDTLNKISAWCKSLSTL